MEKWMVMAKKADFNAIGKRFSIDPVVARIMRNREVVGEEAIEAYLNGDVSGLFDGKNMKDVEKATEILLAKIRKKARIRIIGDYDIDGIMSTFILWKALKECGACVDVAIPDRILDGYGLNQRLIEAAHTEGIDTIVTCDNGIAALDEIALGKSLGMTIVVTDHHQVPYEETPEGKKYLLPEADALVNPNQEDCQYPFPGLCGAGVAYKLVQVLYEKVKKAPEQLWEYLPYVAFATVGDVMELQGENRILVKEGLKRLPDMKNPGLHALIRHNNLEPENVRAYHVGFVLGPCLNASGRLDTAIRALELLRATDEKEALELARDLTDLNTSRKELTAEGVEVAEILAKEAVEAGDKVLVLFLPKCHESLAGIIAGRIRESFHHPTFILTRGEEGIKGSGRSIEGYSMYQELCRVKELFVKFGGHPMAAGVSLKEENIDRMRQGLNELCTLTPEDFIPKIMIDVPMPMDYVTPELVEQLSILEPFGKGNEKPIFAQKNLRIIWARVMGKNKNVCKLWLETPGGNPVEAIYFGNIENFKNFIAEKFNNSVVECLFNGEAVSTPVTLSFVYYPQINSFQGRESIQMVIKNYC